MTHRFRMKLKWRILALFGRYKRQVNFWLFLGLMTALSVLVLYSTDLREHDYRKQKFEVPDLMGYKEGSKDIKFGSDDKGQDDHGEYHSSEEIELDHQVKILENEVRHMGIYRKTLSKALRKSTKLTAEGDNVDSSQVKNLIGERNHVIEVNNLKDEQSEEVSLEADGYLSVLDTNVDNFQDVPQEHKAAVEGTSKDNVHFSETNLDGYNKPVINDNEKQGTVILGDNSGLTNSVINTTRKRQSVRRGQNEKAPSNVEDKFLAIKKCNAVRLQRIKERCPDLDFKSLSERSSQETQSLVTRIIADNKHNVLINAVPKTGTSSWKMVMLNNSGLAITENGHLPPGHAINDWKLLKSYGLEDMRYYDPDQIRYRLQNYYSILTVRHPFERLESTYREKFRNSHNKLYMQTVAKKIVAKFRSPSEGTVNSTDAASYVTFEEFLRYVLSSESNDRHWNKYWDIANPCVLPYQYIAKTETADLDMDYIAATQLSDGQSRGSFRYNPTQPESVAERRTKGNTLQLFTDLHPEVQDSLLFGILEKYMNDMELFGYKIHKEGKRVVSHCQYYSTEGLCC